MSIIWRKSEKKPLKKTEQWAKENPRDSNIDFKAIDKYFKEKSDCHPDTKLLKQALDLDMAPSADYKLRKLAEEYREKFTDGIKMQCEPASHSDKAPLATRSGPPGVKVAALH